MSFLRTVVQRNIAKGACTTQVRAMSDVAAPKKKFEPFKFYKIVKKQAGTFTWRFKQHDNIIIT